MPNPEEQPKGEATEVEAESAQVQEPRLRRGADDHTFGELPVVQVQAAISASALLDPGTGRGNH